MQRNSQSRKSAIAWALYDWANSAFATTVMAGFFPLFFKKYWSHGVEVEHSTFYLGLGNSLSSLALALLAPLLGAIADIGLKKKRFLFAFFALGVLSTAALYFVNQGEWWLAILFYALGALGFSGGNIFYDALLIGLVPSQKLDALSGLGYALGYLGGAVLFTLNVIMYLKPELFGIADPALAVRISFLSVALWWFIFAIPMFLFVPEGGVRSVTEWNALVPTGFARLKNTFLHIRRKRALLFFLIAFLFYNDGVNTIIKMAVDYGLSLGFAASDLITALLITNYVGFPAAIAYGYLGEKWGARKGIYLALIIYCGVTIWGYFMDQPSEFYLMAGAIGLVQGGIQALSRSYYARLIPAENAAEYFGFFNMLGKFSAVLGPVLVGSVSVIFQDSRASILVILVFFAIGGVFLQLHAKESKLTP